MNPDYDYLFDPQQQGEGFCVRCDFCGCRITDPQDIYRVGLPKSLRERLNTDELLMCIICREEMPNLEE